MAKQEMTEAIKFIYAESTLSDLLFYPFFCASLNLFSAARVQILIASPECISGENSRAHKWEFRVLSRAAAVASR